MPTRKQKLDVLCKLADSFNREAITWAVGASLLLYFEGIAEDFHDIDILIHEKDTAKARKIVCSLGSLHQPAPHPQFSTKYFYECVVDGVEIDLICGFAIIHDGKTYDCALRESQIARCETVNNIPIPLQPVSLWREYYRLMGREKKVTLIDSHHKIRDVETSGSL